MTLKISPKTESFNLYDSDSLNHEQKTIKFNEEKTEEKINSFCQPPFYNKKFVILTDEMIDLYKSFFEKQRLPRITFDKELFEISNNSETDFKNYLDHVNFWRSDKEALFKNIASDNALMLAQRLLENPITANSWKNLFLDYCISVNKDEMGIVDYVTAITRAGMILKFAYELTASSRLAASRLSRATSSFSLPKRIPPMARSDQKGAFGCFTIRQPVVPNIPTGPSATHPLLPKPSAEATRRSSSAFSVNSPQVSSTAPRNPLSVNSDQSGSTEKSTNEGLLSRGKRTLECPSSMPTKRHNTGDLSPAESFTEEDSAMGSND